MRKKKDITLQMIADELQLTIHTVSKALRGMPGMSEGTRKQIFETALRLGYKTRDQELSVGYEKLPLLSTKRRRFTMILTNEAPFYQIQFLGIQERIQEWGHSLTGSFVPNLSRGQSEIDRWIDSLDLHFYDGLFIPPIFSEQLERTLLQLPIPKVLINYPPPLANVDSVIWDVAAAIHQSVDHLFSMGHKKILYVGDIYKQRGFKLRWTAFREAMRKIGVEPEPHQHLTDSSVPYEQWLKELQQKLAGGNFTAVLCGVRQDLSSINYTLQSIGLSVPQDISIINVEDLANERFPHQSRPLLLMKEAGRRAAERLLWRIANPSEPYEHIRLQGTFYEGNTVRPIGE